MDALLLAGPNGTVLWCQRELARLEFALPIETVLFLALVHLVLQKSPESVKVDLLVCECFRMQLFQTFDILSYNGS